MYMDGKTLNQTKTCELDPVSEEAVEQVLAAGLEWAAVDFA
jgi:hypothetical protein